MPFPAEKIHRAIGDAVLVGGSLLAAWGLYHVVGPHWSALAGGLVAAVVGFAIGRG